MFKYTRTAINILIEDIKRFSTYFKYGSLVFTTAYFIYALITQKGVFIANIILASLFLLYTFFDFFYAKKTEKFVKKIVRKSYKWVRLAIKAFTLGALVYGVYTATTQVSAMATILTTLMIMLWIMQVVFELLIEIIERKVDMIISGFNQDIEDIKRPATTVGNIIKRVKGQEIEKVEKSQSVLLLENRIKSDKEKAKAEKKSKKAKPDKKLIEEQVETKKKRPKKQQKRMD